MTPSLRTRVFGLLGACTVGGLLTLLFPDTPVATFGLFLGAGSLLGFVLAMPSSSEPRDPRPQTEPCVGCQDETPVAWLNGYGECPYCVEARKGRP